MTTLGYTPRCPFLAETCIGSDCAMWNWSMVLVREPKGPDSGACSLSNQGGSLCDFLDPAGRISPHRERDALLRERVKPTEADRRKRRALRLPPAPKKPRSWVYFIQEDLGGAIKIGTSKHPEQRLKSLQTAHAAKLVLLGKRPGDRTLEKKIHDALASFRVQGEWFQDVPEVRAWMEAV